MGRPGKGGERTQRGYPRPAPEQPRAVAKFTLRPGEPWSLPAPPLNLRAVTPAKACPAPPAPGRDQRARRNPNSVGEASEGEAGVVAAEAEGVVEHQLWVHAPSTLGDVVQVAVRIWILIVDGRGYPAVHDGHHREDRFDGPGTAQAVPGHRLGRGDRDLPGPVLTQRLLDGQGLRRIVELSRGAMGVDV